MPSSTVSVDTGQVPSFWTSSWRVAGQRLAHLLGELACFGDIVGLLQSAFPVIERGNRQLALRGKFGLLNIFGQLFDTDYGFPGFRLGLLQLLLNLGVRLSRQKVRGFHNFVVFFQRLGLSDTFSVRISTRTMSSYSSSAMRVMPR